MKKYKAVSADVTINNIRNILFKNGIIIKETYDESGIGSFKSCHIEVANESVSFLNLRTYGKGMLFEYSLASALAEFMERLQNNLIFKSRTMVFPNVHNISLLSESEKLVETMKKEGLVKDFSQAPDEVFLLKEEVLDKSRSIIHKMLNLKKDQDVETAIHKIGVFEKEKNLCLPFFNLSQRKIEILPYALIRMLYGSNGMAAGNNKKEAFIQGLCEIFERYAMRKIYLEQVKLPTVPNEFFKGEKIYDIILNIEKNRKINIIVKDCSCGIGLPVIGVLLIDKARQKFTFHLGSDPSPTRALERCLTEINQGGTNSFNAKLKDIETNLSYFDTESYEDWIRPRIMNEFLFSMVDGTGYWPNYIFNNDDSFKGFPDNLSKNDEEDIKYLLEIILNNNFEVFVRDVSSFGFTSLQIIIPGMSEMYPDFEVLKTGVSFSSASDTLFELKEASVEDIKKLALALKTVYLCFPDKNDHSLKNYYTHVVDEELSNLTIELFITMLFYRVGDLENALDFINKHIQVDEKYRKGKDLYIYCARDFIARKSQNLEMDAIKSQLLIFHDKSIVDEIIKDFSDPKDIFNYYNFPVCFNCEKCKFVDKCKYLDILRFASKISNSRKKNQINQTELLEILN